MFNKSCHECIEDIGPAFICHIMLFALLLALALAAALAAALAGGADVAILNLMMLIGTRHTQIFGSSNGLGPSEQRIKDECRITIPLKFILSASLKLNLLFKII